MPRAIGTLAQSTRDTRSRCCLSSLAAAAMSRAPDRVRQHMSCYVPFNIEWGVPRACERVWGWPEWCSVAPVPVVATIFLGRCAYSLPSLPTRRLGRLPVLCTRCIHKICHFQSRARRRVALSHHGANRKERAATVVETVTVTPRAFKGSMIDLARAAIFMLLPSLVDGRFEVVHFPFASANTR